MGTRTQGGQLTMIYVITFDGMETINGSCMHPAVRMQIREHTQLGHHVVDEYGHYLEPPIATHPLWQDPLLAAKPFDQDDGRKPTTDMTRDNWWGRFLHRGK